MALSDLGSWNIPCYDPWDKYLISATQKAEPSAAGGEETAQYDPDFISERTIFSKVLKELKEIIL